MGNSKIKQTISVSPLQNREKQVFGEWSSDVIIKVVTKCYRMGNFPTKHSHPPLMSLSPIIRPGPLKKRKKLKNQDEVESSPFRMLRCSPAGIAHSCILEILLLGAFQANFAEFHWGPLLYSSSICSRITGSRLCLKLCHQNAFHFG